MMDPQRVSSVLEPAPPISSGLKSLDRMIGGFYPGSVNIVSGRPGHGKLCFAQQIATHAAAKVPVLYFSLQWDAAMVVAQILRAQGGPDPRASHYVDAAAALAASALFIDDSSEQSSDSVTQKVRSWMARDVAPSSPALIVIDRFALLDGARIDPGHVLRGLKLIARLSQVPVVVVAGDITPKVESRQDKRPAARDLPQPIEHDADLVLILFSPRFYEPSFEGPDEVLIAKQRNGPLGSVPVQRSITGLFLDFEQ